MENVVNAVANNGKNQEEIKKIEKQLRKIHTRASVESMTNRGKALPETIRECEEILEKIRILKT